MLDIDVRLSRGRFQLAAHLKLGRQVTGLFGPSGSGKTSLLMVVAGLLRPDSGRIVLDGKPLFESKARIDVASHRRRVGLVFQDSQLFPHLCVRDNLLYGFRRAPRQERRFQLNEIVELLEIGKLLDAKPRQLSGGEKQRVALGRSLLASPRLLLLDEPLASLDQGLKEQILPFLRRVKEELHLPMLYVSHSMSEVLQLTDFLVLMANGAVQGSGFLRDLVRSEELFRLSAAPGIDNILPVSILAHDVSHGCTLARFFGIRLMLPYTERARTGETHYVSVRSNEIVLSHAPVPRISIQNQLKGRICAVIPHSDRVLVQVDAGTTLIAEITRRAWLDMQLHEGDTAYCLIKAHSFNVLSADPALDARSLRLIRNLEGTRPAGETAMVAEQP